MAKYVVEAYYTGEGAKGLMKAGGSARRAEVQKMVESLKGRHTPIEKNAPSKRRMAHQPNMRKQDYQLESLSESNGKSNFVSRCFEARKKRVLRTCQQYVPCFS